MLKYKDYVGSVTFSDGKLVIKLLHVEDTVTDECDAACDAQGCFEALVDDYIETCEALGKQPSKPFKGTFNVRVSPAVHRKAALAAGSMGQSLNAWVESAMEARLDEKRPHITLEGIQQIIQSSAKSASVYYAHERPQPACRVRAVQDVIRPLFMPAQGAFKRQSARHSNA